MTENKTVKMIDLEAEFQEIENELSPIINQVLRSGNYIQGPQVKIFERRLAQYLKVKHVISCGNGTDALQIALMSIGIQPDDEVIIPAFSYIAVIEVICLLGAKPVLVDIDSEYFQLNNSLIEEAITSKTKAIVPVHLFGQAGNLDELKVIAVKHDLAVIEDVAQALGGKDSNQQFLGTIGDIGCTSFFPTKNLSCYGDGGAIFTNDDLLANKIRMIANHGQVEKYNHQLIGVNSRLDTVQAAILDIKLHYLNKNLHRKKEIAETYFNNLNQLDMIELPKVYDSGLHTWHQFTIKVKNQKRDYLKSFLAKNGIDSMIYYPKPLTQQNAYMQYNRFDNKIAEEMCNLVLSLPIHPMMKDDDIIYICDKIKLFFDGEL